jgi:hypothetical protein
MRTTAMVMLGALAVATGVAEAAATKLPYKTGTYVVDDCLITTNRNCGQDASLQMRVGRGSFAVKKVAFTDSCANSVRSFTEPFKFIGGTGAKLAGKISSTGRFSGSYEAGGAVVKVRGLVRGGTATVTFTESGPYTKPGEPTFMCSGTHKFKASRSVF